MRHFSDRRDPATVAPSELRSKEAMRAHLSTFHGDEHPEDMGHADLRWHHDVIHDNDLSLTLIPHEH